MLLAIDVGNTNTVFAVFKDKKIISRWRMATERKRTSDEYALALKQLMSFDNIEFSHIKHAIISCVVPETLYAFRRLTQDYFKCDLMIVGDENLNLPITVKLDRPAEVGADRIVNAIAAAKNYKGAVIVVDFGTATTFDVITGKGEYIGGAIAPGIDLSLDALHQAAAKLPKVAVGKPRQAIGTNTIDAIRSGIYWGYIGLIEGIVARIKMELGEKVTVVATGGLAPLFESGTKVIEKLEPDLTIEGLWIIFEMNQSKLVSLQKKA